MTGSGAKRRLWWLRVRVRFFLPLVVLLIVPAAASARALQTADMAVTGSVSADRIFVNQRATFTFTATNSGPERANIVRLALTPSSRGTSAGATASRPDAACSTRGKTVTCQVPFLEPGESFSVTMQVTGTAAGEMSVEGVVLAVETDPNQANQQVTVAKDVLPPDSTPPSALAIGKLQRFQTTQPFRVVWKGKDPQTGIDKYGVRYRSAPFNGAFGQYVPWKEGPEKEAQFRGQAGRIYCFSVTATDLAGNTAPYSPEACTSIPVSATVARRIGRWRVVPSADSMSGRYLVSSQAGASLVYRRVQAKTIVLWVSNCAACGQVDVTFAGRVIGRLNLHSETTRHGVEKTILSTSTLRTGDLVLKVVPPPPPKATTKPPRKSKKANQAPQKPAPSAPEPIQIEAFGIAR
jgi:hypothetical protein